MLGEVRRNYGGFMTDATSHLCVRRVGVECRALIEGLYQFHRYDLSEFNRQDIGDDGRFAHIDLDPYFEDGAYGVFVFEEGASITGFALVNFESHTIDDEWVRNLDDFFVLRKYRRQGVGTRVAIELFRRFPGRWQVNKKTTNLAAMAFWSKVIPKCAEREILETVVHEDIHIHMFRVAPA
jgi:predicted acetyltransferase